MGFLVHSSSNMEDIDREGDLDMVLLDQDGLEENNFSMLPTDHSCGILVKNVAIFALV